MASAGVLLAAADTYVVVLALPNIMADIGIGIDQLQRAAPIVSGFLLGYVVVLPLLGRLSDLYGRTPVFLACLAAFAVGSVLTATASGLPLVVAGRTIQGLGGGGLVPVTLALVADYWPPGQRGLPLGIVGAVQELGSVLGPLYGAVVVAASGWRTIFWINVPVAAVLGAAFVAVPRRPGSSSLARRKPPDVVGAILAALAALLGALALTSPGFIADSDTFGQLAAPLRPGPAGALTTPLALGCFAAVVALLTWETVAPFGVRVAVPLRRAGEVLRAADWPGAALLGGVLAAIILAFASADPAHQVVADDAGPILAAAALLALLFVVHERRCRHPLVDLGAFARPPAFGSLVVNFFIGGALMAALVDIPIFARTTQFPDSQVGAALVLVRLLAAVPLGAVLGGVLCERVGYRLVAAFGMLLSGSTLAAMTTWTTTTLGETGVLWGHPIPLRASDLWLGLCGLGFGLSIAPVNAAILGAVHGSFSGLATALVVVARMVGMLVGLSLLTAVGLHRFYDAAARIPSPQQLCPAHPVPGQCPAYDQMITAAALDELHAIFAGAAVCAAIAAILALALLQRRRGTTVGLAQALVGEA